MSTLTFAQDSLIYYQVDASMFSNRFIFYKSGEFKHFYNTDDGQTWYGTGTYSDKGKKRKLTYGKADSSYAEMYGSIKYMTNKEVLMKGNYERYDYKDERGKSIRISGRIETYDTTLVVTGFFNNEANKKERSVRIEVRDLSDNMLAEVHTYPDGFYVIPLPGGGNYKFHIYPDFTEDVFRQEVFLPKVLESPEIFKQGMYFKDEEGEYDLHIHNYYDEPVSDEVKQRVLEKLK